MKPDGKQASRPIFSIFFFLFVCFCIKFSGLAYILSTQWSLLVKRLHTQKLPFVLVSVKLKVLQANYFLTDDSDIFFCFTALYWHMVLELTGLNEKDTQYPTKKNVEQGCKVRARPMTPSLPVIWCPWLYPFLRLCIIIIIINTFK